MSNLSEDIINKYLTGQCSEEELVEVNAWMKESEENARQLFRMEEIYHLGKFNQYADRQQMARAEKQLYKKLDEEKKKTEQNTAHASLDEIRSNDCCNIGHWWRERILALSKRKQPTYDGRSRQ